LSAAAGGPTGDAPRAARPSARARGASAAAAADRAGRLEAFGAWALALATLAFWWPQLAFFPLPNNDFATFEAVARAFGRLELPSTFQRLPLLPAAMALVGAALPGKHALLHAALALNAALAIATLPLLQRFAGGCLGRGSLLVAVLFAGTAQLHGQGLQPLVEPSLAFFVVLAFLGFQRRAGWQYAAAAAAALSRYEAVLLLPLFAAWNAWEDGRWRRHAAAAAAGALPFVLWAGLGALRGSGAAFYAADMERMGFSPAPHVLATLLKESFRGLWTDAPGPDVAVFLALAAAPAALGVVVGLARFPREASALVAYLAASVAVIVLLGIDKARYVYPVLWIPLLFFATGLVAALAAAARRLAALPAAASGLAVAGALALGVLFASDGVADLARAPHDVVPFAADLAYAALLALLAAVSLALALAQGAAGASALAAAATFAAGLAVAVPLLLGGLTGRAAEQRKIRFANESVVVSAAWLAQNLAPGERAVVMHRQHYLFLTELEPERFVGFFQLDAQDAASLAAEMRARGLTHVVATWRKPVAQAIDRVYERKFKWFLVDPFARGEPVAGFERVAELPLPAHLEQPPVQIYRLAARGVGG
jgi:hypothetical protein